MMLFAGFARDYSIFLLLVGLLFGTLFVLGYGFLTRWWRHESGVHVFVFSLDVTLFFWIYSVRWLFGDFSWRPAAVMVLLHLLVGCVVWRFIAWLRIYLRNLHEERRG